MMKKLILMSLFIFQTSNTFAGICDVGSKPAYCGSLFPDKETVDALTTQSKAVTEFVGGLTSTKGKKADRSLFDFSGNDFTPYYLVAPTQQQLSALKASLGDKSEEHIKALKAIEDQKNAVDTAFGILSKIDPKSDEYTAKEVRAMDRAKEAYSDNPGDERARKELLEAMIVIANKADGKERKQILDQIEKLNEASDQLKTSLETISTGIQAKADQLSEKGRKRQEQIARVYAGATDNEKSEVERAGLLNQLIMLKADLISDEQNGVKAQLHRALEKSILGAFIQKKIDEIAKDKSCEEAQKAYLSLATSAQQIACEENEKVKQEACEKMVSDIK